MNPAERPTFEDCLQDPWCDMIRRCVGMPLSHSTRFEACRASDREFVQLQENFEKMVQLSERQMKHRRRWRSLVHWAMGMHF